MIQVLNSLQWSGKGHDASAIVAAALAALSVHTVSDWLQLIVLVLTIAFLCLGILMRWQKIRSGTPTDIEKEDEPAEPRSKN